MLIQYQLWCSLEFYTVVDRGYLVVVVLVLIMSVLKLVVLVSIHGLVLFLWM